MANLTQAKLELWIYSGTAQGGGDGEDPKYTLTKTMLSGETAIVFEVSELIKDYVEIEFDGNYADAKLTKWVKYKVTRTYDDDTSDNYTKYALAFRGYGHVTDGINPVLSTDLMISNTVINNLCGEKINVPFYTGANGTTSITYSQDATELQNVAAGTYSVFDVSNTIRLNPPADEDITIDKTASLQASSDDSTDGGLAPSNTTEVSFSTADGTTKKITIQCIDDCDYKSIPHKVSFLNKYGAIQDMWFFARKKDSISSQRQDYTKTALNIGESGASYNISSHQNVYLQNQGKESFTMDSGYIHESYNETVKELMVSEYVYIHDRLRSSPTNPSFDLAVPVKVVSNSLDVKSRRHDKLISYTLEFEADANFIQSIR